MDSTVSFPAYTTYFPHRMARMHRIATSVQRRLNDWGSWELRKLYVWDGYKSERKIEFHEYCRDQSKECSAFKRHEIRPQCVMGLDHDQEPYRHFVCGRHEFAETPMCCGCVARDEGPAIFGYNLSTHEMLNLPGHALYKHRIRNIPIFGGCKDISGWHYVCMVHIQKCKEEDRCCCCDYRQNTFECAGCVYQLDNAELTNHRQQPGEPEWSMSDYNRLLQFYPPSRIEVKENGMLRVIPEGTLQGAQCKKLKACRPKMYCDQGYCHASCRRHRSALRCCLCSKAYEEEDLKVEALEYPCYGGRHQILKKEGGLHWQCDGHYGDDDCCCCRDDSDDVHTMLVPYDQVKSDKDWPCYGDRTQIYLGDRKMHWICDAHLGCTTHCCCCDGQFQGQLSSTMSGNKHIGASGGSTVNYINYYGAEYANAANAPTQNLDPAAFTDPVTELASSSFVPDLQSPSAEQCGYSDRILMVTAGNSCMITQEAASGAVVAYGRTPEYSPNQGNAVDMPTRPGVSCDRFYTLESIYWNKTGFNGAPTGGNYVRVRLNLFWALQKLGVFGQNCQFHYLCRSGFLVHVQVNATKFHQGCLGVYAIPEDQYWKMGPNGEIIPNEANVAGDLASWTYETMPDDGEWHQWNIYPHQLINIRTNNSATLVLPYLNITPACLPKIHCPWSLNLIILADLDYAAGAATTIPITVSVAPQCSEFAGLRSAAALEGVPTFQVPGSGQFVSTLRNAGYPLYAHFEPTHSFENPGRFVNLLEVAMIGTFADVGQTQAASEEIPDGTAITTKMNAVVGNLVTKTKVFSLDISLSAKYLANTYVGMLAKMFQQYRGSLKYTFTYCGSSMVTGKLLIAYTPPGGTEPTDREQAMLGTHMVWDIGLQSSVSFTVPYISVSQYRMTSGENTAISVCGWISMRYQTSFVYPPGTPTTSQIITTVAAGEDFQFRVPMDNAYFQGPIKIESAVQQLVSEAMTLKGPATAVNPHANDNVTTAEPSELTDAAPALTATETGKTQIDQGDSFAVQPSRISFSRQDTDVEYLLSRYHYVASFSLKNEQNTATVFELPIDFSMISNGTNMARTMYCMATYYRCDFDFVFIPVATNPGAGIMDATIQYMFSPNGSVAPPDTESQWATSLNPVTTFRLQQNWSSVRIPFLSTAHYFSTFFNGYGTFDKNNYGTNPCNAIGSFYFRLLDQLGVSTVSIQVWVRPVNLKVYCPRPIIRFSHAELESASRHRIVVVDENGKIPNSILRQGEKQGPCARKQGLVDKIRTTMQQAASEMGTNIGASLSGNLIKGIEKTILAFEPEDDNHGVLDVLEWVTKLVCATTIIVRGHHDPAIVTSCCVMLGVDILTSDPIDYMKRKICQYIGVKYWEHKVKSCLKQGPDGMRDLNTALNIGKGIDWLIHKIKELIDWVKDLVVKMKHQETMADELKFYLNEWFLYQKDPSKFTRGSVIKLCDKLLEIKDRVQEEAEVPKILFQQLVRIETDIRREVSHSRCRSFEPVALVIRGSPGQGKSLVTGVIGKALSKFYRVQEPYSLPPDPKYFDGYKGQMVTIMDDLGQNPDGADFQFLCQMISTVDFYPPMADLADKGAPFISDFVLASTNLRTFNPPTISDVGAINRRFFIDTTIDLSKDYCNAAGKLDVQKALAKCDHEVDVLYTKHCCPLLCGKAVKLVDKKGNKFSVNEVIGLLVSEAERKRKVGINVDGLFQGPTAPKPILETVTVSGSALPEDVADALMANQAGDNLIDQLEQAGFIVPVSVKDRCLVRQVSHWRRILKASVIGLGVLATIGGLVYAFSHKFVPQGPYEGATKTQLQKPVVRTVNVQGPGAPNPDFQFAQKIQKKSLLPLVTGAGPYTAVGIFGRTVLLPKHAAVEPYKLNGVELKVMDSYELVLDGGRNLELVCVEFENINEMPDLRKFLPDRIDSYKDVMLVLNSDLISAIVPVGRVTPLSSVCLSGDIVNRSLTYRYPTKSGWCGGLLVKAGQIIGLHVGGDGYNGYASVLLAKYFVQKQGKIIKEEPAIWGNKTMSVHMPSRTQLLPSVYHDIVPGTKEPAVLSDKDKRFNGNLKETVLSKYKGNVFPEQLVKKGLLSINLDEVRTAVQHYVEQLRPLLPEDVTEPLTLDQAIEGYHGLQKLDSATSAGFPYNTMGITKKQLMANDRKLLLEGLDLHGYGLPYTCYLKDELRSKEKILTGNTRVIEASSINDSLHARQVFGRLYSFFCENPGTATGMAVGCNPDRDWTRFQAEFDSSYVISFDYKNFDASLSPMWFAALQGVLQGLGFDENDVEFIIDHMCFSVHLWGDTFVHIEGGMPSGCSGTSIFNSMINNIILKTIIPMAYKGIDLDALKILAYGDDVLVGYPFPLNGEPIAKIGALFGLTITPADKGEIFTDGGPLELHTFLKRGFKRDDEFDFLVHPTMDKTAIYESLRWTRDPKDFQDHVRCLCELMWHHGKEEYEEFRNTLKKSHIYRALNIPPYEYLRRKWLDLF
ncbi:polyprotein [Quail picornavirus QPV1/HUN/2010]|uniref:polyprotein n=1 Tax=Quail picornavirus QPV1/HUN/2010 TaxID=1089138 RepID=UPI000234A182|nr:polyprotein [Quail picornavirus QPV1/HUN/2010]AEP16571.1 polyprotein [Quail picornavirus QPV1/HUN/2010]